MKLSRLTREHISKNIPKSSKIHDYTRRAHVLRDVSNAFRERTYKHESKRESYESSERRFNHLSFGLKDLQAERAPKSNRKTRCIQRLQSYDKLCSRVACVFLFSVPVINSNRKFQQPQIVHFRQMCSKRPEYTGECQSCCNSNTIFYLCRV